MVNIKQVLKRPSSKASGDGLLNFTNNQVESQEMNQTTL
jgi:hypothetical protein